ncbi:MAG: two-component regulator propeller domain-containing protein, partial [Ignavibacteriales bacterium]
NPDSTGVPGSNIFSIAIDSQGNKWVGTDWALAKFDGLNWTAYIYGKSGLPGSYVSSIAVDNQGIIWAGTHGGVAKFNGQNWTAYTVINSKLPGPQVNSFAIDQQGNKWIGTDMGLAKFDGQNWTVFKSDNSGLPSSYVLSIAIDEQGNKWIGTTSGIAVFREEGVILTDVKKDKPSEPKCFLLHQNYPNPFNPSTTLSYSIPEGKMVTLKVYDMLGKEIAALVNEYKEAGTHSVQFNASSLPSGVYIYTIQAGELRDSRKLMLLK